MSNRTNYPARLNPLFILIVEDEPAHIEAITRSLRTADSDVRIQVANTLQDYRRSISSQTPDIVIMDLILPDGRAIDVLTSPPDANPFPVVVMTSYGNEKIAVEAMKAGALDYIVKSVETFTAMPRTIERTLREWKMIQEHNQVEEALQESEQRIRVFLDSTSDMAFLKDENFRHIIVNRALCKFYGKTENEIIGKTDFELMAENSASECRKSDEQTLLSNALLITEEVIGELYYEIMKFPVELANGKIGVGAYIRDITERKSEQEVLRESTKEREKLIQELQSALDNIKTLQGLIPMCASCKKIRDDKGFWSQVEEYIVKHTDAEFTHGICPDCAKNLYGDLYEKAKNKINK